MPYVNEAYSSPNFETEVGTTDGSAKYTFFGFPVTSKSQYGWRSGPLSDKEREQLEASLKGRNWATSMSSANALERLASASTQSPRFARTGQVHTVHERQYEVSTNSFRKFSYTTEHLIFGKWVKSAPRNAVAQAQIVEDLGFPPITREKYDNQATSLMRSMRPTKSEFELARFVGEARELPMLGRLLKLDPRNIADYGSGFLGYNFGLAPTVSDVQKLAETIAKSETVVTEFAQRASHITSRKRSIRTEEASVSGLGGPVIQGLINRRNGKTVLRSHGGSTGSNAIGDTSWDLTGTRHVRAFAQFEYFVADPHGFTSRMGSYVQRAEKLLGVQLDAATAWELTPWTWMSDWFLDIGGLLAYQQDVADHGLVARRSGYLVEDTLSSLTTIRPISLKSRRTTFPITFVPAQKRIQRRFKGSPYSMSPNWDLSGFQWAIVGALGLTKAPKIPFS